MKELKCQLQAIAETISLLSKQFEIMANKMDSLEALYQDRTFTRHSAASEAQPVIPDDFPVVKETADNHTPMNTSPNKNALSETDDSETLPVGNSMPVLSTVLDIIRRSRKGVDIAQIRKKTNFSSRQISNALYKLSKIQGKIESQSRGVYVMKKTD